MKIGRFEAVMRISIVPSADASRSDLTASENEVLRNRARIIAHCLYELVHWFIVPEIESAHPVDTEVQS